MNITLLDITIILWVQEVVASTLFDTMMPFITFLGDKGLLWLGIGFILLFSKKYRFYGVGIIAAVALAALTANIIIKPLVARPRPFIADPTIQLLIATPGGTSFPSGHSASSFAAATLICFIPIRKHWKVLACATAALIAFSRIYLLVHYPSDILVGSLIGIICGLFVGYMLNHYFSKHQAGTKHSPTP